MLTHRVTIHSYQLWICFQLLAKHIQAMATHSYNHRHIQIQPRAMSLVGFNFLFIIFPYKNLMIFLRSRSVVWCYRAVLAFLVLLSARQRVCFVIFHIFVFFSSYWICAFWYDIQSLYVDPNYLSRIEFNFPVHSSAHLLGNLNADQHNNVEFTNIDNFRFFIEKRFTNEGNFYENA